MKLKVSLWIIISIVLIALISSCASTPRNSRPIIDISKYEVGTPIQSNYNFYPSSFYSGGWKTYDPKWRHVFEIRSSEINFITPPDEALTKGSNGIKYLGGTGTITDGKGNRLIFTYGDILKDGHSSDYNMIYVSQPGKVTIQIYSFTFEQAGWHLAYIPTREVFPLSTQNYNPATDYYWCVLHVEGEKETLKWVKK